VKEGEGIFRLYLLFVQSVKGKGCRVSVESDLLFFPVKVMKVKEFT